MNKKIVSGTLVLTLVLPTLASAATWYSSSITLPRTGSWKTVEREATGSSQQTQVTNNKYDVLGRIISAVNGSALSSYVTHQDTDNSANGAIFTHKTNTKVGDRIKGEFKTAATNFRTTTATIAWAP